MAWGRFRRPQGAQKVVHQFLEAVHLGERLGDIVELESKRTLGQHKGFWFYTIGQRQGLGLSGGPWYVVQKNTDTNTIYVSHKSHQQDHARDCFTVTNLNWITTAPERSNLHLKLRHGPEHISCRIKTLEQNRLSVALTEKTPGIAPGQFAVFYDNDICLGHGVIE